MVEAEDVPVLPHIFPGLTECGLIGSFVAQIVKRGNRHRHAVRLKVLLVVYQMAAVVMHDHGQSRCGVGGHACGARAGRRKRCAGRRANGPAPRAQLGNLLRRRAVLPARRARFFTGCPLGWPGSAYFASGVYFIIE